MRCSEAAAFLRVRERCGRGESRGLRGAAHTEGGAAVGVAPLCGSHGTSETRTLDPGKREGVRWREAVM